MHLRLNVLASIALLLGACNALATNRAPMGIPTPLEGHDFEIHLQGGFEGDEVLIRIDGALVYQDRPETNPVLDLAETLGARAAEEVFSLTIEVPAKHIAHTQTLDLNDGMAVGVSLYQGQVFVIQADWFGYA